MLADLFDRGRWRYCSKAVLNLALRQRVPVGWCRRLAEVARRNVRYTDLTVGLSAVFLILGSGGSWGLAILRRGDQAGLRCKTLFLGMLGVTVCTFQRICLSSWSEYRSSTCRNSYASLGTSHEEWEARSAHVCNACVIHVANLVALPLPRWQVLCSWDSKYTNQTSQTAALVTLKCSTKQTHGKHCNRFNLTMPPYH